MSEQARSAHESGDVRQPQERLSALCQRLGVVGLYAFGSRAREALAWLRGERAGLAPGSSDLDIGVKLGRDAPTTVRAKVDLALALEDLFGAGRVDLVVLDEADPFLAANIIRGNRLYSDDEYRADEYDLYVLRRAGDLVPLERERMALILSKEAMISGRISRRVVTDRLHWVDSMLAEIRALPLADRQAFFADRRNLWAAESCLRRALEALFDLGRHILERLSEAYRVWLADHPQLVDMEV